MARPQLTYRFAGLFGIALLATTSCTVHKQETPSLTGPSELSTAVNVSVSPDQLTQDGASQSLVTITARDSNGQPLRNLTLRAEIAVNGVLADFGSLSARTVVTDASGRASLTFTAPAPPVGPAPTTSVEILVTPLGSDFGNATARSATIRLVPSGTTTPPRTGVTAAFTVTPAAPNDHEAALFDGSGSKSTTGTIVQWLWNFGDGGTASGEVAQHTFNNAGAVSVTLTVTDSIGASNFTTQSVVVGQGTLPTAQFVTSPSAPIIDQQINFNAAQSRPAPGRTIRSFDWSFGDGATGSGAQTTHSYSTPGTYNVVLTITDDAGRTATVTQGVTVSTDLPIAKIVVTPASPTTGAPAIFDGSSSTAANGRTLVSFQWTFTDDGSSQNGATVTHTFTRAGTFAVTLRVTDNVGKSTTTATSVTAVAPTTTPLRGGGNH